MQEQGSFEQTLKELAKDKPDEATLYELSNLHGETLEKLDQAWPSLPEERREYIVARLAEIAEADFEADFAELFKLCLKDPSPRVRATAIDGLWEVEDVILVRPMIDMLREDPSVLVREASAAGLSRFALMAEMKRLPSRLSEMVWDVLWDAAHDPEEDLAVCRRSIEALAHFDRPEVAQLIRQAYADDEPKMRVSAVFAMGRSSDQDWSEVVLAELETDDAEMRYEAARACGELRLIEATQQLSRLVADADTEVKLAAVWSLGQISTPEAQRVLEICYEQGDEALQDAAEEALDEMDFVQGNLDFPLYDLTGEEGEEPLPWDEEEAD
ncbi:MAG TPA: HEAT repeat domain-containing protein [Anaerolineae bacterium]|nr:HEAT repeat domain-containing protein [Anaerolineae bacterium]